MSTNSKKSTNNKEYENFMSNMNTGFMMSADKMYENMMERYNLTRPGEIELPADDVIKLCNEMREILSLSLALCTMPTGELRDEIRTKATALSNTFIQNYLQQYLGNNIHSIMNALCSMPSITTIKFKCKDKEELDSVITLIMYVVRLIDLNNVYSVTPHIPVNKIDFGIIQWAFLRMKDFASNQMRIQYLQATKETSDEEGK